MTKRFHDGARSAFKFTAILLYATILAIPFAAWIQWRAKRACVVIDDTGLVARNVFATVRARFDEIARLGVLRVRLGATGIAGHYARKKVGGDVALQLWLRTRSGKTRRIVISMYEDHDALVAEISRRTGLALESIAVGALGAKWAQATTAA